MKNKKFSKRIIAVVMAVLMVMLAFPMTISSDGQQLLESIDGVDYRRIQCGFNAASMNVYIDLGGFSIPGKLEVGNCVAREDANKIIREVMAEEKVTSDFLREAQTLVNRTAARYSISAEEVVMALSGKVGDAVSLMKVLSSQGNFEDLGGLVTSALAGGAAIAFGIEGIAAYAIGALASLGYTELCNAIKAHENGEEMSDIATSIVASAKLAGFYSKINDRIKDIDKKKGTTRINFSGTYVVYNNQSFMGIGGQEIGFKAEGELASKYEFDIKDQLDKGGYEAQNIFNGEYTGDLTITIDYHLENFDTQFKEGVFNGPKLPYHEIGYEKLGTMVDIYEPTVLTKKLSCKNLTVKVDARKPRYGKWTSSKLPLKSFTDKSNFRLDHRIFIVPDEALPYLQPDGTFSGNQGGASIHQEQSLQFWYGGSLRANRYADLIAEKYQQSSNLSVQMPGYSYNADNGVEGDGNVAFIKDNDAFRFLSGGAKLFIDTQSYEDHR